MSDLPPALRERLEAHFHCPVLDLYSLNEAGPIAVADATAGSPVVAATASAIQRPNAQPTSAALTTADMLTMAVLLNAVATLRQNAVPEIDGFLELLEQHRAIFGAAERNYGVDRYTNHAAVALTEAVLSLGGGERFYLHDD
jgi:hypothetical protein